VRRLTWIRGSWRPLVLALALLGLATAVAACGSSGNKSSTAGKPTSGAKKGGTLTLLSSGDVDDKLDPGYSYYQFDFVLDNALHRTLFTYKPTDTTEPSPDLAAGPAQISDGGKTVTVKIKSGVKFSPPVNREVTSADVAYAMTRDFNPAVGNGYAGAYWGDIIGSKAYAAGKVHQRHPDAGSAHACDQAVASDGGDRDRRDGASGHGTGAEGLRR
jgi:peptide/nickel transport system substrate-binding protein